MRLSVSFGRRSLALADIFADICSPRPLPIAVQKLMLSISTSKAAADKAQEGKEPVSETESEDSSHSSHSGDSSSSSSSDATSNSGVMSIAMVHE